MAARYIQVVNGALLVTRRDIRGFLMLEASHATAMEGEFRTCPHTSNPCYVVYEQQFEIRTGFVEVCEL